MPRFVIFLIPCHHRRFDEIREVFASRDGLVVNKAQPGDGTQTDAPGQGPAQEPRESAVEKALLLDTILITGKAGEVDLGVGQIPAYPHLLQGDEPQTRVPHLTAQDLRQLPPKLGPDPISTCVFLHTMGDYLII